MVAVVEDDESYRLAIQRLLKSEGFSVQSFTCAEEFLDSGRQPETGCLIADIRMPGMSGLDLQAKLNADHCPIPIIFVTAHGEEKMRAELVSHLLPNGFQLEPKIRHVFRIKELQAMLHDRPELLNRI